MVERIGNAELTHATGEPVDNQTNPNWRWADCWRPLNLYRILLTRKTTSKYVVKEFLSSLPTDSLTQAMFPKDVQKLLISNEEYIVDSGRNWVGHHTLHGPPYPPIAGVNVTDARPKGIRFDQEGAVGPMSMEASFILATQLAGINWYDLRSRITPDRVKSGVYWLSAVLPGRASDQYIMEERKAGQRELGYLERSGTMADLIGSPEAGFYLVVCISLSLPFLKLTCT